ncbi:MAG: site-specific DNA-methyltransferase [Candidatus Staskawiczbacteria bacterium]|nr:site-specific DNA-methyltransferase [Candidatus Staskawiczbacteria bacterium]
MSLQIAKKSKILIDDKKEQTFVLPINQIICGDAIEELKKLPDRAVSSIITDPPYGISKDLNCKNERLGTTAKLNFNFGEWDKLNNEWLELATQKTNGWFISFCAKKDIGIFWNALEKNGFIAVDALVWQKPDPVPFNAKSRFLNAWEIAIVGKRPGAIWNSTYQHNIFKYQAPKNKTRIHPTQKPLELIKELVLLTTKKGDIVLDPFMGSGTTAVACKESGRNYLGFEIDKKYCELANNRVNSANPPLFVS